VLLPIESIYEGTWGGGQVPDELPIAEIILETGWSFQDYITCPPYLRQVIWDVIQIRRRVENDRAEAQRREAEAARRGR
jgi:hypothetical protein